MNNHKTDHQTIAMKHIIHISSQMSTTIIMLKYSLAFGVAAREERKVPIHELITIFKCVVLEI